ncbi:hypothetical protein [Citricoccus sp.]|uniref:hypothetical protein n=1 Tax=Citricoccus sp. TaxID=1978372 RepID=UPI0028BED3C9|nr:hypothetical protein [Citricoccus sp.]
MSLTTPFRRNSIAVTSANTTRESVLADLAWETLANELEAWLDAGHPAPLPEELEARPAGTPPEHLQRRMAHLTTRLSVALREMRTEQDGVAQSLKATARAQRMTQPNRGATAAYLDTGA